MFFAEATPSAIVFCLFEFTTNYCNSINFFANEMAQMFFWMIHVTYYIYSLVKYLVENVFKYLPMKIKILHPTYFIDATKIQPRQTAK